MGIGDWGLGIGDWGLGPIPNPQSPIPNPHYINKIKYFHKINSQKIFIIYMNKANNQLNYFFYLLNVFFILLFAILIPRNFSRLSSLCMHKLICTRRSILSFVN